jgi:hypothetical protein
MDEGVDKGEWVNGWIVEGMNGMWMGGWRELRCLKG